MKKSNEDKFEEIRVNIKTYMLKCLDTQYRILKFDVQALFSIIEEAIGRLNSMFGDHGEDLSSTFLGNFFSSYFGNIDAGTSEYHTEMDGTYTFIIVPPQVNLYKHDVQFSFMLSKNKKINIKMQEGVSMIY